MKRVLMLLSIGITILSLSQAVYAGDKLVIIANKANQVSKLTMREIKRLYENDELTWSNGDPVNLYDLPITDPARQKFSQMVLGKDAEKVVAEWASKKITNTAQNPPVVVKSVVLIQERVSKEPNAIGYLLIKSGFLETINSKVKIVATFE